MSCCNQQSYNIGTSILWFIISAIGQPAIFLLTLPFPKHIFLYEIPDKNIMMLNILPFIVFAITAKSIWYMLISILGYICGNNVYKLVRAQLFPQTILSLFLQLAFLIFGYINLYQLTIRGMDVTIVGIVFFIALLFATCISMIMSIATIYKILRKRYV